MDSAGVQHLEHKNPEENYHHGTLCGQSPAVEAAATVAAVAAALGYSTVGGASRKSVTSSGSPDPEPPGSSFFLCSRLPLRIISSSLRASTGRGREREWGGGQRSEESVSRVKKKKKKQPSGKTSGRCLTFTRADSDTFFSVAMAPKHCFKASKSEALKSYVREKKITLFNCFHSHEKTIAIMKENT